jgi:hypothetical protein
VYCVSSGMEPKRRQPIQVLCEHRRAGNTAVTLSSESTAASERAVKWRWSGPYTVDAMTNVSRGVTKECENGWSFPG